MDGRTVFTDAGKRSKKAACTWLTQANQWDKHVLSGAQTDSLQILELKALVWALNKWDKEPLNIVSDSLYVVGVIHHIERALIREITTKALANILNYLLVLLHQRAVPYFITHIRSHLMQGGLAIGNDEAHKLVVPAWVGPAVDTFTQARCSHQFFHQSAKMLAKKFRIPLTDAQGIVKSCHSCRKICFGLGIGVNPRGLKPLQTWQMDVTHVNEFGTHKYVHVCIDTYSQARWATAQSGEATKQLERHLCYCFAVLGVPTQIKTDNGPGYTSIRFKRFCNQWGITHDTGIPHSPTSNVGATPLQGQAILEHAHQTLKNLLLKQKGGTSGMSPHEKLHKALYVLNYLRLAGDSQEPPMLVHSLALHTNVKQQDSGILVRYKDLQMGEWVGPAEVKLTGRGYMCLLTGEGLWWVPARWVKPFLADAVPGGCSKAAKMLSADADTVAPKPDQFQVGENSTTEPPMPGCAF